MASTDNVFDIQPCNYYEEMQNFEEVTATNDQHYKHMTQKVCKSAMKETEEIAGKFLNYSNLEEAIETLFDASKNIEQAKIDILEKSEKIKAVEDEKRKSEESANLTAKAASEFSEKADIKQRELTNLKKNLEDKDQIASARRNELVGELTKWKEILGLELINSTHGGVILVFTSIIRDDPDRRFVCELEVDNDKKYVVKNCNPDVPEVTAMVDVVNRNNDLSGFVAKLRKKFADLK